MKSFKQHLTEGISPIVYHYTNMSSLVDILKSNEFKLSTDIGTNSDLSLGKKQKFYYFSTTRHKLGGYNLSPGDGGVMLKLDGTKLGQRYKGGPVDYWGPEMNAVNPRKRESEDRIYHTDMFIKNASKYILEVHSLQEEREKYVSSMESLFWPKDKDGNPIPPDPEYDPQQYKTDDKVAKRLRTMWKLLLQKKIPHWFYKDKQSFLLQNKAKAIKIDIKAFKISNTPVKNWFRQDRNWFSDWQEMYYKKDYNKLSDSAKKEVDKLKYAVGYRMDELETSLSNDIHNEKNHPSVRKIVDIFKKLKIQSPKEFIELMKQKWSQ